MTKHFKLTSETKINSQGKRLFRIEAIIDFGSIKKGEKGGWIESEENLSDKAWVYGEAQVSGEALNFCWHLTLTDGHIRYGCEQKKIPEWVDWLKSSEEFETPRKSERFKLIEMALNLAIEYRRQNPIQND